MRKKLLTTRAFDDDVVQFEDANEVYEPPPNASKACHNSDLGELNSSNGPGASNAVVQGCCRTKTSEPRKYSNKSGKRKFMGVTCEQRDRQVMSAPSLQTPKKPKNTVDVDLVKQHCQRIKTQSKRHPTDNDCLLPTSDVTQIGVRNRRRTVNRQLHRTFCDLQFADQKPNVSFQHYIHPLVKSALGIKTLPCEDVPEHHSYVCIDIESTGSSFLPSRYLENFTYEGTKVYSIQKQDECLPTELPDGDYAALKYNGYIFFYEWFSQKPCAEGKPRSKKKATYLAKCKHCGACVSANTTNACDGLQRHLNTCNNFKSLQEESISCTDIDLTNCTPLRTNPLVIPISQNQRYVAEKSSTQTLIDDSVVEYIMYEKLPFRKSGSPHLKVLLQRCNPSVRIRSDKTYKQYFEARLKQEVEPNIHLYIRKMLGTTLIVDHWSNTRKESVTGVRLVGIIDFKVITITCAVRKTTGHTSMEISAQIAEVLEKYNAKDKIRFTQTDNAANMIKAMRSTPFHAKSDTESEIPNNEGDFDDLESEIAHEEIIKSLSKGMPKTVNLTCKAHSINNGIKAGLKDTKMYRIVQAYQKVVGYIHHCPLIMDELRLSKYNCVLQSIGATRWNSCEDSMSQALAKGMISFVNSRLERVRGEIWLKFERIVKRCLEKGDQPPENPPEMPPPLETWDVLYLYYYCVLTRPLSVLLDLMQADGITSTKFLPMCVRTFSEILAVQITTEDESEYAAACIEDIKSFRIGLINHSCKKLGLEVCSQIDNNRVQIPTGLVPFLHATVFDPRYKTEWFDAAIKQQNSEFCKEVSSASGSPVNVNPLWLPSSNEVEVILKATVSKHAEFLAGQSIEVPNPLSTASSAPIEEIILKWSKKDNLLQSTTGDKLEQELLQYLREPTVQIGVEDFDVLKWWKIKSETMPLLASLACMYIAFPVSSAAVERLFSELKAYCMGNRNQTEIEMLEKIVKFRESLPSVRLNNAATIGDFMYPLENDDHKDQNESMHNMPLHGNLPTSVETPKRFKTFLTRRKLFDK